MGGTGLLSFFMRKLFIEKNEQVFAIKPVLRIFGSKKNNLLLPTFTFSLSMWLVCVVIVYEWSLGNAWNYQENNGSNISELVLGSDEQ